MAKIIFRHKLKCELKQNDWLLVLSEVLKVLKKVTATE